MLSFVGCRNDFKELLVSENNILCALIALPIAHYEMSGLFNKYYIKSVQYSVSSVKVAFVRRFYSRFRLPSFLCLLFAVIACTYCVLNN